MQAALYAHGDIQQLHTCLHALTAPHPSSLMMRVTLQHVDLAVLCALCHDEQLSACLEHQQPLQAAAAAWQPRVQPCVAMESLHRCIVVSRAV